MKRAFFDAVGTWALTAAAVVIAITVVHREFFPGGAAGKPGASVPVYVDNWKQVAADGALVGSPSATVTFVEFSDFQCPYCKRFHEAYLRLRKQYGDTVALVFMSYPIEQHEHAAAAARAAECSRAQGVLGPFMAEAFSHQKELGVRSWTSMGKVAGVRDVKMFDRCVGDSLPLRSVVDARRWADSLKVNATPTVLINGWRYVGVPPDSELTRVVQSFLNGKEPYPEKLKKRR